MSATVAPQLDPRRYFEAVSAGHSVAEAMPVCLYLEVTNRCNLLCETCPRTFEALEPPADMSWEMFTRIVDQVPGVKRVVLHGVGEPMLVKHLPDMVRYLKARGTHVLFNTNGTLLAPKKHREIIETGLNELRVSLDAAEAATFMKVRGKDDRLLLSLVDKPRLESILKYMLDEEEFPAPNGIRSLSKFHKENPVEMDVNGQKYKVEYLPGDSDSGLFGGNSNWRGPIWMAPNFLLVESLLRCYMFYGNTFKVECPTGSGDMMHLGHVAEEVQHRLTHLMAKGDDGRRAINDGNDMLDFDEHWKDTPHFYEFFDGDTGRGLGASHQCGWTGLIAKMIHDTGYVFIIP